jgi:hypothetical protein
MCRISDALCSRQFHLVATVVWFTMAIPTLTIWRESIPWLAFMSLYANVVGHWSSYQASRAEEAVKETTSP